MEALKIIFSSQLLEYASEAQSWMLVQLLGLLLLNQKLLDIYNINDINAQVFKLMARFFGVIIYHIWVELALKLSRKHF